MSTTSGGTTPGETAKARSGDRRVEGAGPSIPVAPPSSPAGSAAGRILLGTAVFLLSAASWTLLAGRVIGPAIIGDTPINQLPGAARTLTYVLFAGVAFAGFLSGAAVARRARRDHRRRGAVLVHAAWGPIVGVALLVGISYFAQLPIEPRSTTINAVFALLGAVIAAALVSTRWPGSALTAPDGGSTRSAGVGALCLMLTVNLGTVPGPGIQPVVAYPAVGALPAAVPAASETSNDIEPADCALRVRETTFTAGFTLFSLDAGPSWTFAQKELPPQEKQDPQNRWQDTVDVGVKVGFKLVVGQHLLTKVLGPAAGEGLSISEGSHAAFDVTSTYPALPQGQADDVIRWSLNRYGLSVLALPGLTELVLPTLESQPAVVDVQKPTSSEFKLGGTVSFDFEAGAGISYKANLEVGDDAAVALKNDTNTDPSYVNDPQKVDLSLGLSQQAGASVADPIGDGLSGHLSGDSVLSMEFEKSSALGGYGNPSLGFWAPVNVSLESTFKLGGALDTGLAMKALIADGAGAQGVVKRMFKALKFSSADEHGASLELAGSMNIDITVHPEILIAAVQVLGAAQDISKSAPAAGDRARYRAAVNKLAALTDQNAVVRGKVYQVTSGTAGIDIEAGDGLAFGASIARESNAETLLGGFYRDKSHTWLASTSCKPGL